MTQDGLEHVGGELLDLRVLYGANLLAKMRYAAALDQLTPSNTCIVALRNAGRKNERLDENATRHYDDAMTYATAFHLLTPLDILVIIGVAALLIGFNVYSILTRKKY